MMISNYEPYRCREITQDVIPPFGSAIAIVYFNEGRTYMIPGSKRSQRDTLYLLHVAWRSDVYEVSQDTAEIYESFLWATCQQRGWM